MATQSAGPPAGVPGSGARATLWLSAALVALTVGFRLVAWRQLAQSPYATVLAVDAQAYHDWAVRIAGGDWLGTGVFYQDPLYPYLLALLYRVTGPSIAAAQLVQIGMAAISACLLVALARRAFAGSAWSDAAAWGAGFAFALATPLAFYDLLLLKTPLVVCLGLAHLLALARADDSNPRAWPWLAAGLLLGANALLRGNYLVLAPFACAWVLWRGGQGRLRALAAYLLGALLVIAPVTLRNGLVAGQWVPVTAQGGMNLYTGNHPGNLTGGYDPPDAVRPSPRFERDDFVALAARETGREMSLSEADRYFRNRALAWMRDAPGDALALYARKWLLWLAGYEVPDNYGFRFMREHYLPVLSLPLVNGYTIGLLGWSALVLMLLWPGPRGPAAGLWRRPALVLLLGYVLAWSLVATVFFVFSRYRAPVYPALIALGAGFAAWLPGAWRALPGMRRTLIAGVLVLLAWPVSRPLWEPDWWSFEAVSEGTQYYNAGNAALERGRVEEGVRLLEQGLALLGGRHREAHLGTVQLLALGGELARAEQAAGAALAAWPDDVDARYLLARLRLVRGDAAGAARLIAPLASGTQALQVTAGGPPPLALLALARATLGDLPGARAGLVRVLEGTGTAPLVSTGVAVQSARLLLASPRADERAQGLAVAEALAAAAPQAAGVLVQALDAAGRTALAQALAAGAETPATAALRAALQGTPNQPQ